VLSARHAVSIDERRKTFLPTLWDNIAALNQNAGADALAYSDRPYQQKWFPGRHSGVGGGEDDHGLSISALLWIAQGAVVAGLALDPAIFGIFASSASPCAPFVKPSITLSSVLVGLIGMGDRNGPNLIDEVSDAAQERWSKVQDYRPPPLRQV